MQAYPNLKGIISPDHRRHRGHGPVPLDLGVQGQSRPHRAWACRTRCARSSRTAPSSEFALWDPAQLGYVAAFAGKALADGNITGAEGDTFDGRRPGRAQGRRRRHRHRRAAHASSTRTTSTSTTSESPHRADAAACGHGMPGEQPARAPFRSSAACTAARTEMRTDRTSPFPCRKARPHEPDAPGTRGLLPPHRRRPSPHRPGRRRPRRLLAPVSRPAAAAAGIRRYVTEPLRGPRRRRHRRRLHLRRAGGRRSRREAAASPTATSSSSSSPPT